MLNSHKWWKGSETSEYTKAALTAVKDVWKKEPLMVREGGTMPILWLLQDLYEATAVQLPLGQASDSAHLANERLSVRNFDNGCSVIVNFLRKAGAIDVR
eukprot:Trichotokara_eunicae@DN2272_c0_g1_i3.p1